MTRPIQAIFAAVLALTASSPATGMERCGDGKRISCIVDGDTFWLGGTKIRIAGIDAPELSKPKCASERALAERATVRLQSLLSEENFELVRAGRDEDVYGRKLRLVLHGQRSVGDVLVAEGLARAWDGARRSWCD